MLKKYNITVNGVLYQVEVEEVKGEFKNETIEQKYEEQKLLETEEANEYDSVIVLGEKVESPMPGTILEVNVSQNQNVKSGEVLFILEAMKMENEIMSPKDGKVVKINVTKGVTVNTGDLLLVIE
ncbi:biotin/lipoyl-containing protein [Clostridium frigidicarnis]|uniref:Biotin-requiring enzyme n=1 Tax=Clostridium frigidicarnis TaxID=84698 RepID=A0A1I1AMY4_9CLOT|nr:biotin/lipoyl-containing protein [Clostridium frigidicarnis]SFB39405.1 Biotin-requiring enzyme [Clostridium frigidicarnis]